MKKEKITDVVSYATVKYRKAAGDTGINTWTRLETRSMLDPGDLIYMILYLSYQLCKIAKMSTYKEQ